MDPLQYSIIALCAGAILVVCIIRDPYSGSVFGSGEIKIDWRGIVISSGLGVVAALLYSAAVPLELADSGIILLKGLGSGVIFAFSIQGLFWLSAEYPMVIGMGFLRSAVETANVAMLNPIKPISGESLSTQRLIISTAAASGSIMGSLVSLRIFWTSLGHVTEPRGVVAAIVMVIVSVAIFEPSRSRVQGHEHTETGAHQHPSPLSSSRAAIGWVLRSALIVLLEVIYVSLDHCVRSMDSDDAQLVLFYILFCGIIPFIITFYCVAAIQSEKQKEFGPALWACLCLFATINLPSVATYVLINIHPATERGGSLSPIFIL